MTGWWARVQNPEMREMKRREESEVDPVAALEALQADPRYLSNLDWGKPRSGHPEGTIRAHLKELESNLRQLASRLSRWEIDRLRLLIHSHDTFKPDATPGVPISDPRSHASLAREFLAEFFPDPDLLAMVQSHDEPFALWNRTRGGRSHDSARVERLLAEIGNHDLFSAFLLVDGCTRGKTGEPLRWWFLTTAERTGTRFGVDDVDWLCCGR